MSPSPYECRVPRLSWSTSSPLTVHARVSPCHWISWKGVHGQDWAESRSTIIMVDEYSHMVWVENMKSGQELCPVVEELLYLAETEEVNEERSQIRCIRINMSSDSGSDRRWQ